MSSRGVEYWSPAWIGTCQLEKGDVEAHVHPDKVADSPDLCRELQVVQASGQILQNECWIGQPGHLQGSRLNLSGWESILLCPQSFLGSNDEFQLIIKFESMEQAITSEREVFKKPLWNSGLKAEMISRWAETSWVRISLV